MIEVGNSCLVVVDVQGKLAELMYDRERLFANIEILIRGARILGVPTIWCQQCPDALGATVGSIASALEGIEPVNKSSFSCWGDNGFKGRLLEIGAENVLLCGIETHVCIYQTAVELMGEGKQVTVVADAVSSRTESNKRIALERVAAEGGKVSSCEMVLFELLGTAEHKDFRQIARLIR